MKLAAYLQREDITNAAFARLTGLSEGTVSLLARDEIWLSKLTASKIFEATKGQVTPNDFLLGEAAE